MQDTQGSSGSKILIANPGTGKTTELSGEVVRLLKAGTPPSEILCLTFTVKATEEILNKIRIKCLEADISDRIINELEISTFHSFAWKYVSEAGLELPLASSNLLRYSILKSAYKHKPFNYNSSYVADSLIPEIENSIRFVKSFGILPWEIEREEIAEILSKYWQSVAMSQTLSFSALMVYLDFFVNAYSEYEAFKKDRFYDYNDILLEYLKLPADSKKKFPYVLVDELQDVNDVQAKIIEEAGKVKFLVGDRKQSIFGFQGGSLSVFRKFVESSEYNKKILGENHRSTEEIIDYSREFFRRTEDGTSYNNELDEFVSEGSHGNKVGVLVSESGIPSAVNMISLLSGDKLTDKRIALITRTNDQLLEASRLLDEQKIEYTSTAPPSTSVEARNDLLKFLDGLFQSDKEYILNALFTPFSGLSLREAFNISTGVRSGKITDEELPEKASPFYEMRNSVTTIKDLDRLFVDRIIPVSVPLGRDYTLTIMSMKESLNEFFQQTVNPSYEDLSDYLRISEGDYEPVTEKSRIILSTVHKAKGLEFDDVIYVPSRRSSRASFIDAVTRGVIQGVKGIDVSTELSGEDDRVDFVAFTRAKTNLKVVTGERHRARYSLEGFCETDYSDERSLSGRIPYRYNEAYNLFLAGKLEQSGNLVNNNWEWVREEIWNHFRNLKYISFSAIEGVEYPVDYLIQSIFKVPSRAYPLLFGSKVHEIAQSLFEKKDIALDTPELKQIHENINAIHWTIENTRSMQQEYAELKVLLGLPEVFKEFSDLSDVKVIAYLDAVFKSKSGDRYLIVDYKTDRSQRNGSKHRRQLLLYRKLLSSYKSIPEDDIDTAVAYISLREAVNTGEIEYQFDDRKPATNAIETVKKKMSKFLEFKHDPDRYIEYLISKHISRTYQGDYPSIADSVVSFLKDNK